MAKFRVTTDYRNRLGIKRKDVRVIEAEDDADRRRQVVGICEEISAKPGRTATGGWSKKL